MIIILIAIQNNLFCLFTCKELIKVILTEYNIAKIRIKDNNLQLEIMIFT